MGAGEHTTAPTGADGECNSVGGCGEGVLALKMFLLFTDDVVVVAESRKLLLLLSSLRSSASSIWDEAGEEAPSSSLGSCLTTIKGASRVRMAY